MRPMSELGLDDRPLRATNGARLDPGELREVAVADLKDSLKDLLRTLLRAGTGIVLERVEHLAGSFDGIAAAGGAAMGGLFGGVKAGLSGGNPIWGPGSWQQFIQLGYVNSAAASQVQDYTIINVVLLPLFTIVDGHRRGIRRPWLFFVASLFTSCAFAYAFYFAVVERQHRARASRAGGRRTDAGAAGRGVQPAEPLQLG